MQRCVTKANGEMAYQLLYQQEAFVTFTGYQMFTRFVSFAMDECRNANVLTLRQLYPEHTVLTVNTAEPVVEELVALDTVGVVAAEDSHQPDLLAERSQRFVSHNQKDDYVHRGKAAVLQAMSLVLYSRFVVRRKKEQKVIDYFRYFPFDSHYEMHHAGFIQEIRIGDNNVVVPMQLRLPSEQEQPEKHYSTLLLLCNAFDGCASSAHCADTKRCFSCHDVTFDHKQKKIFVVFRSRWRRVYARMKMLAMKALQRSMSSLSVNVVQDVVGMRWWFPKVPFSLDEEEMKENQQRHDGAVAASWWLMWFLGQMMRKLKESNQIEHVEDPFAGADLPRVHENIAHFLPDVYVGFHPSQLTPLEFFSLTMESWVRRYVLYHEARASSSSKRRAERFKYINPGPEEADDDVQSGEEGVVQIEGDDVEDGDVQDILVESMEQARHPVTSSSLDDILYRTSAWQKTLKSSRSPASLQLSLVKLQDIVEAIGGFPDRISLGGQKDSQPFAKVGMDRTVVEVQLQSQENYLEAMFDGSDEGVMAEDEEQLQEMPMPEVVDSTDPFLVSLNEQNLEPKQYAWQLVVQHQLNPQQTLAVAPVVQVVQQMYEGRSNQASYIADGKPAQPCRCLWLGAGGSGKTYSYTRVLRPLLQRFCGSQAYVAAAPTHAAARLLGLEARTMHKLGGVNPQSKLDRESIRTATRKRTAVDKDIEFMCALIIDEMSMTPSDIYHCVAYRCSVTRQPRLQLDLGAYMHQCFGNVEILLQLGDFFQLRPIGQKSLCEWVDTEIATLSEDEDDHDTTESNMSELGRLLFKNTLQHVVHFTGTGRFLDNQSGRDLVTVLRSMRTGVSMPDDVWERLAAREVDAGDLQSNQQLRQRFLSAHWGAFSWEQVGRLQQIRAGYEALNAQQTIYYVQAVDTATDGRTLTREETEAALKQVNMNTTGYLLGMLPLYVGMPARISAILSTRGLSRELPCIVKQIVLHPREPKPPPNSLSVVLRCQPLAVVVEVEDPEYKKFHVPGSELSPGQFLLQPKTSESFALKYDGQTIRLKRRQAGSCCFRLLLFCHVDICVN